MEQIEILRIERFFWETKIVRGEEIFIEFFFFKFNMLQKHTYLEILKFRMWPNVGWNAAQPGRILEKNFKMFRSESGSNGSISLSSFSHLLRSYKLGGRRWNWSLRSPADLSAISVRLPVRSQSQLPTKALASATQLIRHIELSSQAQLF